jgi:1-aminocyclopropane-1-carboxylate deaminase/D-cysteine desulfhydrase-like pyridoxal-dependent ACC family enzyme
MYHDLLDAGIAFDLIYGAVMWQVLLQHHNVMGVTVLYIHSGGLLGNASMLDRYRHRGML